MKEIVTSLSQLSVAVGAEVIVAEHCPVADDKLVASATGAVYSTDFGRKLTKKQGMNALTGAAKAGAGGVCQGHSRWQADI